MDYAVDKLTGLLVEATQALPIKKRYICPKCFADCHLRKGIIQRPHFAHDSGRASNDCENYHPSKTISSEANWSVFSRSPHLYVYEENTLDVSLSSWKLLLLIPECSQGTGNVDILQGYYGTVNIPVGQLARGGQRVCVHPQVTYQIEVNGQVDDVYQKILTRPIPGLSKHLHNLFKYEPAGGRRLHDNQFLFWGQSYYLVWHKNFEPVWWPRPEVLWSRRLKPNGEWVCAIINLPIEEEYQVKKWVENILHKGVSPPQVTLSLLSPIVIRQLEDESFLIPITDDVIICVIGNPGAVIPQELHLHLPSNETSVINVSGPLPVIISLGQLPPGRTEIWFPDNPDIALSLFVVEVDKEYNAVGVSFLFEETTKQHQIFSPAHSLQTRSLLEGVQRGYTSLVKLTIPRKMSVTFRSRGHSDTRWQEFSITGECCDNEEENLLKHKEFEERIQQEILKKLSEYQGCLEIDFKNYGKVNLILNKDSQSETYAFQLPWRRKIEWMLSSLQANRKDRFSPSEGMKQLQRIFKHIPIDQLIPEDRLLIDRLLSYKYIPVTLESCLREITKYIRNVLNETDKIFK